VAVQASFEGLTPRAEVVMVLGPVVDAAALYGLLRRVQALGLELVDVRQVPCDGPRG
jgi:hypothetical protein